MFSVVIPAYNHERFIARTVDSVLSQTFADFELIIVDDGSVDATADRVKAYSDKRITLVEQANAGEAGARNAGIAHAHCDWIAFLDSDDYWFPNHLAEAARIIADYPSTGFVSTSYISGPEWQATPPDRLSATVDYGNFFGLAGRDLTVASASSVVIRRDVIDAVGGFSSYRRGADQEYWARVALVTPLAHSGVVTVYYYQHPDSIMALDQRHTEIAPNTIEEMWPSVGIIRVAQADPRYHHLAADFMLYERQATYLSMIGYMSRREFAVARRLARRLPGQRADRAAAIAAMLRLPDQVLNILLDLRGTLRGKRRTRV